MNRGGDELVKMEKERRDLGLTWNRRFCYLKENHAGLHVPNLEPREVNVVYIIFWST